MSPPAEVYLGVGSNIDPRTNIAAALELLAGEPQVRVMASSTFYRTAAINRPGQPDYLNGVWRVAAFLPPLELKKAVLRPTEDRLGRKRSGDRWAARAIDLDILLYGDLVLNAGGLLIPGPAVYSRAFVAVPLAELHSDVVLPDTGRSIAEVAAAFPADGMTPDTELTRLLRARIQ